MKPTASARRFLGEPRDGLGIEGVDAPGKDRRTLLVDLSEVGIPGGTFEEATTDRL